MKKAEKLKAKKQLKKYFRKRDKETKKTQVVREFLEEVNYHAEQVSISLRHLANAIDNLRSYHLGEEKEGKPKP
jgi:Mg2+ and Co2+ transporter CorA